MDESLSDFQETKRNCAGPKNIAKAKSSKPKKAPKRIRGQKDIRSALKPKKNELESFSKDFDNVCKKSGIDVDPEQLQLAIALSKSIQETASSSNEVSESTQTVNTQDRIGKIRTTLQEYGFKVPEVKIAKNTRKVKKHRKNYKLISTSDTEKQEIIANKYSHILLQNTTPFNLYSCEVDTACIPLFYLASNVSYDILKVKDTFYVTNLIEKSLSTGNLLRNWSEIPGRPVSPQLSEPSNMNFSEIECSQDELDIILSGSLKNCKNILRRKTDGVFCIKTCKIAAESDNIQDLDNDIIEVKINDCKENSVVESFVDPVSISKPCRSCSPDIFDDDASSIFEESKHAEEKIKNNSVTKPITNVEIMDLTECVKNKTVNKKQIVIPQVEWESISNITKRKSNDLMELTECIQNQQLSQKSNSTKRLSNDYMEITECVAIASQPIPIEDNIDLTQNLDVCEEITNKEEGNKTVTIHDYKETNALVIDLLECKTKDRNSECSNEATKSNYEKVNVSIDSMDLTQSSNTSDELPFVSLTVAKGNSQDDTIIVDVNDYADINKGKVISQDEAEIHIDLTQYPEKLNEVSHSQSFFDEYIHDHSSNTEDPKETKSDNLDPDKIDLTQNVDDSLICNIDNHLDNVQGNHIEHPLHSKHYRSKHSKLDHTKSPKKKTHPNSQSNSQEICSRSKVDNMRSPVKTYASKQINSNIIDAVVINDQFLNSNNRQSIPDKVNLTLSPIEKSYDDKVRDIDLTQNSDTSEELNNSLSQQHSANSANNESEIYDNAQNDTKEGNEISTVRNSQRCSSLGKKDDISIDYDDFIDTNKQAHSENPSTSTIYEIADENIEKHSHSFTSNSSQISEVFEISDKELDYSLHQSKLEMSQSNFEFGGISIMDELSNLGTSKNSNVNKDTHAYNFNDDLDILPIVRDKNATNSNEISPIKHRRITEISTPHKSGASDIITVVTPQNSKLLIKTNNVTPMADYESMSLSEIHAELDKYGIKPFKRKRAIQLLTHIYNQTHPMIETYDDNFASPPKRHKPNEPPLTPIKQISPRKLLRSPRKDLEINIRKDNYVITIPHEVSREENSNKNVLDTNKRKENKSTNNKRKSKDSLECRQRSAVQRVVGNSDVESIQSGSKGIYNVRNEVLTVKEIECKPEDWVFQKREKAKVHSCRVPLHIAFYNYVSSRPDLREAILCYEPVEIDVIHKDLVEYGHRYDPKDLLKFLDKKCITVKTNDNDARNLKR